MNKTFGWLRWKNLGWENEDGLKYYEGSFKTDGLTTWTLTAIRFWSNHPTKAMRQIYEVSDIMSDVLKFDGKKIVL